MGIFKRLTSLVKSNTNEIISRAEDPEKMLNQTIVEMGHQLNDAKKQVAEAISVEKRLRKQWETELEKTKTWKEKATMAVRAGDDGLAKEALSRKREHEQMADEYQKQWEDQRKAVDQLKGALKGLNTKIEEAKRKKNLLVAKKKRADTQRSMSEAMSGMDEAGAFETFDRMEKQIDQSEAEAESAAEMAEERSGDNLSDKFEQLQAASDGDMELLALKDELGMLEGRKEDEVAGQLEGKKEKEDAPAAEAVEVEADADAGAGEAKQRER